MLRLVGRRDCDWSFEMSRDALLHHMLQACEGAHDDIPVLANHVDAIVDVAAQCRGDERSGPGIRVDKGPPGAAVRVERGGQQVLAGR
jgi:hypothetical protein